LDRDPVTVRNYHKPSLDNSHVAINATTGCVYYPGGHSDVSQNIYREDIYREEDKEVKCHKNLHPCFYRSIYRHIYDGDELLYDGYLDRGSLDAYMFVNT
jgi:hypothetical protein